MSASADFRFPPSFLFGCATAAHQVEGGTSNDWTRWEGLPGHIRDGSVSGVACDHYSRYEQDLELLHELGQNAYRYSVEWSRIEPVEGRFDHDALRHYRDVARKCHELGMTLIVTLHHFTFPQWLADLGGLEATSLPWFFARFASLCTAFFGDQVEYWVTVNEPVILVLLGYLGGYWPPGAQSMMAARRALKGALAMHAAGAAAIHAVAEETGHSAKISIAHHERRLLPATSSVLDHVAAATPDYVLNRWFLRSIQTGRVLPPVGHGERMVGLAGSMDYLGLNWYTNERVVFDPRRRDMLGVRTVLNPDTPVSDYGWAILPFDLTDILVDLWDLFGLEIMITENGVADSDDHLRPDFIVQHLRAVARAMEGGVPVLGYMHWSSMDNFEWAEGYSRKFGLMEVDRSTMERRLRPSARVYESICRTREIPAVQARASASA